MSLPKQIKYSDIKPIGVPTDVRYMKFTPQTSFGVINNSDQIRFQINSPGFWDPYSAYLSIEVDFAGCDPGVFYQLDGSGHSLINELVLSCGGNEIERIQEYDTLGSVLADMSYSPEIKQNRQYEGVGFKHTQTDSTIPGTGYGKSNTSPDFSQHYIAINNTSQPDHWNFGSNEVIYYGSDPLRNPKNTASPTPYISTFCVNGKTLASDGASIPYPFGLAGTTIPGINFGAGAHPNYTWEPVTKGLNSNQIGYWYGPIITQLGGPDAEADRTKIYQACPFTRADEALCDRDTSLAPENLVTNMNLGQGLHSFGTNGLVNNGWEPKFSSTYDQRYFSLGNPKKGKITKGIFTIPLLSGIFGILMPKECYKYIPIFAFRDLMMDFRINPYAFFTSGYMNDVTTGLATGPIAPTDYFFDKALTTLPNRKAFKITKFEINVQIILFEAPIIAAVENLIKTSGIVLNSASWYLGPQYLVSSTQAAAGTWHVNLGFESLKSLIFLYLSNDYLTYPFCRKQ